MRIALKFIDSYLGRLAALMFRPQPSPQITEPATILFIRPGGIGDAVLLATAISSLKHKYPNICITILAEQRNAGVLSLIPAIDKVFRYDSLSEFIQALFGKYDVVIDTEQWHHLSAVVARLVKTPIKIGFDTNERRRMFTHAIEYDQCAYEADNFISLLKPLKIDCPRDVEAPTLSLPLKAVSKAALLLQPLGSDSFVALFPGASIPEKRWGADNFRQVAKMLSVFGIKIVVVGGKEDRQQGEVIAGGGLGLNLAGLTSLPETAAVIQKSALLLSGDSGVLHIAVGLDVPTVSLFGPGRAKKWAPRGERHIVINKELPCSPCTVFGTTPPCSNKTRCMSDITVDEVVNAVTMLLTSVGAMPSQCCKRDWIEMP
ncbi:MAG: glycosyltransferase family 9 protein [Desulfuromonadaceae bacterium]|nr:glycosyltransferase family 9 protein [Desulfuromonadaceae bacterium]